MRATTAALYTADVAGGFSLLGAAVVGLVVASGWGRSYALWTGPALSGVATSNFAEFTF